MNFHKRFPTAAKSLLLADRCRNSLLGSNIQGGQCQRNKILQKLLSNPRCQRINGHQIGKRMEFAHRFKFGRGDLPTTAAASYLSPESEGGTYVEHLTDKGLIEPKGGNLPRVIKEGEGGEGFVIFQLYRSGLASHGEDHRAFFSRLGRFHDGFYIPAVLIGTGKMEEQILHGINFQHGQCLGSYTSHARQNGNFALQCYHRISSLPFLPFYCNRNRFFCQVTCINPPLLLYYNHRAPLLPMTREG